MQRTAPAIAIICLTTMIAITTIISTTTIITIATRITILDCMVGNVLTVAGEQDHSLLFKERDVQ